MNTGWSVKSKLINSPSFARAAAVAAAAAAAASTNQQQLTNGSDSSGSGPTVIQPLSEAEQETVLKVIKRAEMLVSNEHQRVG